jgi:hypothetical protein
MTALLRDRYFEPRRQAGRVIIIAFGAGPTSRRPGRLPPRPETALIAIESPLKRFLPKSGVSGLSVPRMSVPFDSIEQIDEKLILSSLTGQAGAFLS